MNINVVKATVSQDDQGVVSAAIASIKEKLPFLVDLSVDDRKSMVKISTKGYSFVKQALDVASQHPGVLPASFDVNEMRNDTQLFAYLTTLQLTLSQLKKQIDDTVMQIGSQAYAAARVVYASASSSFAGPPLEVAVDQLGRHFGRKPKAAGPATAAVPAPSHT
jgi:hypothetical protein